MSSTQGNSTPGVIEIDLKEHHHRSSSPAIKHRLEEESKHPPHPHHHHGEQAEALHQQVLEERRQKAHQDVLHAKQVHDRIMAEKQHLNERVRK
ncbi:hypothetical protein QOT17_006902 [Balamuthia mandrillaris]